MVRLRCVLALNLIPLLSLAAPSPLSQYCNASLQFNCHESSKPCIPLEWICDGVHDCPNGQDESHCSYLHECSTNQLMCRSGECVSSSYRCDDTQDCLDGSDERGCEEMEKIMDKTRSARPTQPSIKTEILASIDAEMVCDKEGNFRCSGGKCVNSSLVCDGKRDCPLGEDESISCYECASRLYHKCSHTCTSNPRGHKCSCPRGMILGSDQSTCEDVDECLRDGQRCSQMCINLSDGYACSCALGYELDKDRHNCHLREKYMNGTVYVAIAGVIQSVPMYSPLHSSKEPETYLKYHYGTLTHLALDIKSGHMFATSDSILAVVVNGQIKKLRDSVTGIDFVAVDWVGGNVLYTVRNPSPAPGIYLCKMNGLYCRRIIRGVTGTNKIYRGLSVNPLKGLVAWIEGSRNDYKIMVANMDGSHAITVVDGKLSHPYGLTFDVIKNELYFSEGETLLIEKVNVDSGKRTTVLYNVDYPSRLVYFDNRLYWTEWFTATLNVASVGVQQSTPQVIYSSVQFPYGIALNHSFIQPPLSTNPCEDNACPWMCVAVRSGDMSSPLEGRCVCPDEYEINGEFNSTIKGSLPCKMKKNLDANDLISHHVSVEAMQKYCETGDVCFNGGSCVKHANTRGRVVRITCECAEGYGGLWCEIPPLPDADDSLDAGDKTKLAVQNEEGSGYDL